MNNSIWHLNTVSINVTENVALRSFYKNLVSTEPFLVTPDAVPNFKNKYSQEINMFKGVV